MKPDNRKPYRLSHWVLQPVGVEFSILGHLLDDQIDIRSGLLNDEQ